MHEETFYVCDFCGISDSDPGFIEGHEQEECAQRPSKAEADKERA